MHIAPMRIAHVVDSMEVGGAETMVSQMCRLQRELGHDPAVYAVAALGPLGERLREDGFKVEPNVGRHLLDSTRSFYRIFSGVHPDVVHLHNPTPSIYAGPAAGLAGVAVIVSTRHSLAAKPRRLSVELKYSIAASFCDRVVGICDATVENLKAAHPLHRRKIARIYNGTVGIERTAEKDRPVKEGFTLVYVGRLAPVKNHALLLTAFKLAALTMPTLRLWMVGDGSERKGLESLAAELGIESGVTFWGQQLDVAPYLSAADAFIMSSRSEGLPMSLLQAFSLGLPAIVTDVGGMAEVVRMAEGGITVSPTDPAAMAAAMIRLASDKEGRTRFAQNAVAAFQEHFTLQAMVGEYLALYSDCMRESRR